MFCIIFLFLKIKIEKILFDNDDAFFQPDWAGACWGRWVGTMADAELVCKLWVDLQTLCVALLCKNNKKEEGPAGASPVAASMPKSVSF